MIIKEFIQFIELLLNELLQSKRILAFPNGSNFGKAKVTCEMQRENFIFFYFNTEAQRINKKFKNAVSLCLIFSQEIPGQARDEEVKYAIEQARDEGSKNATESKSGMRIDESIE